MITEDRYRAAIAQKDQAEATIGEYFRQKAANAEKRWQSFLIGNSPFTDADLVYSAGARCHCGAGLAYPKDCMPNHRWDCSDFLKGKAKDTAPLRHEILPFAFYSIISELQKERARNQTTRPQPQ